MKRRVTSFIAIFIFAAAPLFAHDPAAVTPLVIDTDMGLDDTVMLSLALQCPNINLSAVVASEGVSSPEMSVDLLGRMLNLFNRSDAAFYAPAKTEPLPAPPFRGFASAAIEVALKNVAPLSSRDFSPKAYVSEHGKTVVLVLGPLTNIAAAFEADPTIADRIDKIVCAGSPDPAASWNMRYNAEALAAVRDTGVKLEFVRPDEDARKRESWASGELKFGSGASIGENFVKKLLADAQVRGHYFGYFTNFFDELTLLYWIDKSLFEKADELGVYEPANREGLLSLFERIIANGRQGKQRVVFVEYPLPAIAFQFDVRKRRRHIIERHGEAEWFAQLLMNEFHEHLGAYSVIGVKMGLRAAELLNAPQHGIKVTSRTPARPPVSCLNDGVIVATGATPGRGLFKHEPADAVAVMFEYNGRALTLKLKDEYRDRVKARIKKLLERYTLDDHEYWHGVRALGLDIWTDWRRGEIFTATWN